MQKNPLILHNHKKKFVLHLHYNGRNSFLYLNALKIYQFKPKKSEVKDYVLCLDNISKDFTIDNMKISRIKKRCKMFWC